MMALRRAIEHAACPVTMIMSSLKIRPCLSAIERLTRLTLAKTDRRGVAGPKPAPVVRKVAAAQVAAPSSKRPHHMPHRDPRGGRPVTVETRSGHRPSFRSGEARLGREVKGRR